MSEPKYYMDDKAILEEMIRLEKAKREAEVMGILGAGTIGLDAAGLKTAGTMARIGTRMDPSNVNLSQYDEMMDAMRQDRAELLTQPYIDERQRLLARQDRLGKEVGEDLQNLEIDLANERAFEDARRRGIGLTESTELGNIPVIGTSQSFRRTTDENLDDLYDYYDFDPIDVHNPEFFQDQMTTEAKLYQLDQDRKFEKLFRDQDIARQANEMLAKQQRGYGELAAAVIPFVGGIDMMYSAYQDYVNAQNQIEKMMKQATPEQKAEFEKKLKEERMKQYQLKDSDFKYK